MNKYDTLKLKYPAEAIEIINPDVLIAWKRKDLFRLVQNFKPNTEGGIDCYYYLTVNSALNDHQLICKDNINELINKLNPYFLFKNGFDFFSGSILEVHQTEDVKLEMDVQSFLKILARLPFGNYHVIPYRKRNNQFTGLTISSNVRCNKGKLVYLSIYDKFFKTSLPQFEKCIRIERKFSSYRDLRKHLEIEEVNTENILNSTCNSIETLLSDLYNRYFISQKSISSEDKKPNQIYFECFYDKHNGNVNSAINELKSHGASSYHLNNLISGFSQMSTLKTGHSYGEIFHPFIKSNLIVEVAK